MYQNLIGCSSVKSEINSPFTEWWQSEVEVRNIKDEKVNQQKKTKRTMKKIIITFITLAFFAISCNQTRSQAQTTIKNEVHQQKNEPIDFVRVGAFWNGLAAVRLDDRIGFIDTDSNIVILPQFAYVHRGFTNRNFAEVRSSLQGERFFIDRTGARISREAVVEFYRQEAWERFKTYPLISSEQVARIAPIIEKWIAFYDIDLSQARLTRHHEGVCFACPPHPYCEGIYFREYDSIYWGFLESSPNRRRSVDLGGFGDSNMEIYFIDHELKHQFLIIFLGSGGRAEDVFWQSDDMFVVVGHYCRNRRFVKIYDIANQTISHYIIKYEERFEYPTYVWDVYFKERGIIVYW